MFRKGQYPSQKEPMNVMMHNAGLGDNLAALMAVNYICHNFPWVIPHIWIPDYMVNFAKHLLPKGQIIRGYSQMKHKGNPNLPGTVNKWSPHTPMRTHPLDHAFHTMVDLTPSPEWKNYLQIDPSQINIKRFKLPEKYVVMSPGATTKVKELPVKCFNDIVDYATSKGYTPVFLGKKEVVAGENLAAIGATFAEYDLSKGINLIEQTTLLESAAIIAGSRAIIGMEGGLTHLAGFTDTNIIAAYTFVDPRVIAPYRNNSRDYKFQAVTPPKDLGCRFCQTNVNFVFDVDYRDCFYRDFKCKEFTIEDFKPAMDKVL